MSDWFERALGVQGWMTERELGFLHGVALSIPAGGTVVEVGSWRGRSTVSICEGLLAKRDVTLACVDTFRGSADSPIMLQQHRQELAEDRIYHEFRRNVAAYPFVETLRMSSEEASGRFADESIDWIFIDAQHTFEPVRNDIRWWWPKVKIGGLISGHDYLHFDVKRAVHAHLDDVGAWESVWYSRRRTARHATHMRPLIEARTRHAIGRVPALENVARKLATRVGLS